jgi:hypothetical protein
MATRVAKSFDTKFGEKFLKSLPACPGVYFIYNSVGSLIYVGKAKHLRRRLGQYRNAKRRKKHAKMRAIVLEADRIEFETCVTDLDACLKETLLIQTHRPKWNVAGAFSFLYPMVGTRFENGVAHFCYTTEPEYFAGFEFHGAFRSRYLTREAHFALMELLAYVGHRMPRARGASVRKYSHVFSFRQIPEAWLADWRRFLRGDSQAATEALVLSLIENAGARHSPRAIQELLNSIKRFWRHEVQPLRKARLASGFEPFPVPQKERDLLFLRLKAARGAGAVLESALKP